MIKHLRIVKKVDNEQLKNLDDLDKKKFIFEIYKDGIKEENIYAFGDADNDIEVISHCSHGIAMKNSSPFLLNIAKNVTEYTNNEDGVAKYILDHII